MRRLLSDVLQSLCPDNEVALAFTNGNASDLAPATGVSLDFVDTLPVDIQFYYITKDAPDSIAGPARRYFEFIFHRGEDIVVANVSLPAGGQDRSKNILESLSDNVSQRELLERYNGEIEVQTLLLDDFKDQRTDVLEALVTNEGGLDDRFALKGLYTDFS